MTVSYIDIWITLYVHTAPMQLTHTSPKAAVTVAHSDNEHISLSTLSKQQ